MQDDSNRTKFEQSEPIQQQESEQQQFDTQPEPEQQPTTTQSEDEPPLTQQQQSKPIEQQEQEAPQVDTHQQQPKRGRVKQKAQRYSRPEEDESTPKKQKTNDQVPSSTQENLNKTTQRGQPSTTTVQETLGFLDIPAATHELAAILQFRTSYELVEWFQITEEANNKLAQQQND